MNASSGFKTVGRHYAVQSLFNACYAGTLQVAARFLAGGGASCPCRPAAAMREMQKKGLLPAASLDPLHKTCMDCRRTLERAAFAWERGDADALRARLAEYRQAAGAVRRELLRLAR